MRSQAQLVRYIIYCGWGCQLFFLALLCPPVHRLLNDLSVPDRPIAILTLISGFVAPWAGLISFVASLVAAEVLGTRERTVYLLLSAVLPIFTIGAMFICVMASLWLG